MKYATLLIVTALLAACSQEPATPTPDAPPEVAIVFKEETSVLTGFLGVDEALGPNLYALGMVGPICVYDTEHARLARIRETGAFQYLEARGRLSERGVYKGGCPYVFQVSQVIVQRALTGNELATLHHLGRTFAPQPAGELPGAAGSVD
jgi:hypothetical protein